MPFIGLIVLTIAIIATIISGFYYYNKHEHNQTASICHQSGIDISSLYSYDEAQDIINEGRFL